MIFLFYLRGIYLFAWFLFYLSGFYLESGTAKYSECVPSKRWKKPLISKILIVELADCVKSVIVKLE